MLCVCVFVVCLWWVCSFGAALLVVLGVWCGYWLFVLIVIVIRVVVVGWN